MAEIIRGESEAATIGEAFIGLIGLGVFALFALLGLNAARDMSGG